MEYKVSYREVPKGFKCVIEYKDNEGKWKQKSKQPFKRQKDAKDWIDATVKELEGRLGAELKLNIEYKDITFKKFKEKYINHLELHKEYNTFVGYSTMFDKFSDLDDILMKEVKHSDIQECVDNMIKKGIGSSTIEKYVRKLNTVFNVAVKPYKAIIANPIESTKDISMPETKTIKKIKALTKAELEKLLNTIHPEEDYIKTLIASTCGLRIGEIMGLTWNDINFDKAVISVNKQWKELDKGTHGFGNLKSKNSNREVPIPPRTITALKQYKNNAIIDFTNNRLFLDERTKTTVVRLFTKYRKLGYNISVHDLRHTYATMLIANGVDFKTAAKFLGHTVEMTMKTYSHVNQDMIDAATLKIQNIF